MPDPARPIVTQELRRDIAILWIDNPPVNAMSTPLRTELAAALRAAEADTRARAIVLAARGKTFISGADIREFGAKPAAQSFATVVESIRKPIIAALHGTTLGGGFETALASDYRVAAPGAIVGLTEVRLGVLPGGGGTQRFPRLIGIEPALEAMVTGEWIPADKALKLGAIDRIIEGDLVEGAVDFANAVAADGLRRLSAKPLDASGLPPDFFVEQAARAAKIRRGETAPARIVACVEMGTRVPFEEGLKFERAKFAECLADPQAPALRHAFFAERAARRIPNLDPAIRPAPVARAGIVGAGTMGGGIAMSFANAGVPVTLVDATQEGLDRGMNVTRRNYENSASRGRLTANDVEERMKLIRPTLRYDDLADADFIIEAVYETMNLKKQVFRELDRIAKRGAVLASNTSRLSIDEIASATGRPEDVIGTHFFSPANIMRLCEIVRGPRTSQQTLATTIALAKTIQKIGVVAGDSNGFIGNRMSGPAAYQATMALLEGATPAQVDGALQRFGMAMGTFRVSDMAGLDVSFHSRKNYPPESFIAQCGIVADRICELGRFGQKTNAGYYDYQPGDRTPHPSELVHGIIRDVASELKISQREVPEHELAERYLLGLVNEGCEVLREGVAYRSSDIDLVYLTGYGFPAYRGGPLYWAEKTLGLETALERIRDYATRTLGGWLKPSPLLERAVAEGVSLDEAASRETSAQTAG